MTCLIYDDIYLKHDTGSHPETADRLKSITAYLKKTKFWSACRHCSPRTATPQEIARVHRPEYIEIVKKVAAQGGGYLDGDTIVSPDSFEAAGAAAGGVLTAVDAVMQGDPGTNALCLVRPPGHHALAGRGMGFCLFNNVAIGTRYVQKKYQCSKVLIIDWDMHHGNGTQAIFEDDPTVFYFSMHRFPYYPGTGSAEETGVGRGKGFTFNIPVAGNIDHQVFVAQFGQALARIKETFTPDFIFISAGFDGYKNDPLGGLGLEVADFQTLTAAVKKLAAECCGGRIVSVLEGGYSLDGLPLCIEAHLKGLR